MRIIGGKFKGKKLHTPKGGSVRPTSDRLRENIFNILIHGSKSLHGALFMDVFSGTGAMGLEALSRGAAKTIFVEKQTSLLTSNIRELKLSQDQYHIFNQDALALLDAPQAYRYAVDFVFMDAPFDHAKSLTQNAIHRLIQGSWLKEEPLIMAEIPREMSLDLPQELSIFREITAASSKILMIKG